jgi:hypothetical protein
MRQGQQSSSQSFKHELISQTGGLELKATTVVVKITYPKG